MNDKEIIIDMLDRNGIEYHRESPNAYLIEIGSLRETIETADGAGFDFNQLGALGECYKCQDE